MSRVKQSEISFWKKEGVMARMNETCDNVEWLQSVLVIVDEDFIGGNFLIFCSWTGMYQYY